MAAINLKYPSFSPYLPFRYFDSDAKIFVNAASIGFAIEIPTLTGANEDEVTRINNFLMDKIPDSREGADEALSIRSIISKLTPSFTGFDFGIYLYGSDKIGWALDSIDDHRDDVFGKVNQRFKSFLKHSCQHGVPNQMGLNLRLRDYRAFIFVSTPTKRYNKALANQLVDLREDLLSTFKGSRILDDEAFLTVVRSWLNPDTSTHYESVETDKTLTLDQQALDLSFELNSDHPDRLIVAHTKDNKQTQTTLVNLSLERLPDQFALWQTSDNYFNLSKPGNAIGCPFLISLHFRLEPFAKSKDRAHKRFRENDKMANSPMGKLFTSYKYQAQDWSGVREGLDDSQFKLAQVFYNVLLFTNEARYKIDRDLAIESFQTNNIKLTCQQRTQTQSLCSIIPFNISEGCFEDLKLYRRLRTMTTINVADLMPVVADPSGANSGAFFSTYRNQTFLFDPFALAGTGNANIAIAGYSGGGKSFLIQHIVYNILSDDGIVFIIDVGGSYQKLTQLLSQYIKASYINASTLKMSLFAHLKSEQDLQEYGEQIVDLFAIMIEPKADLSKTVKVALNKAVTRAFKAHLSDTQIDHVVDELKKIAKEETHSTNAIEQAAFNLSDFNADTQNGTFFNGFSQFDPQAKLIVLEMGDFDASPDLKSVVLYAMIMNINQRIYRADRSIKKVCLIDEAWRLLKSENKAVANFIENGYRTIRKHGGLFCTVVQHLKDYIENIMASAIWANSTFKLILRPEPSEFREFLQKYPKILSPLEAKMVGGFDEAKNQGFSSALLKYGQGSFYLRLIVDPFSRVLFSTEPKEFQAVDDLMAQGVSLEEAVMMVAKARFAKECEELGL